MNIALTAVAGLGLALTVTTNAAAGTKWSYNEGDTVVRAISGNSVVGQLSDGYSYCEYHAPNSAVFGRDFEVYAGNWGVRDNYICYWYPGAGEDCQRARVQGNRVTFLDASNGWMVAQGTILQGNVCS
jgi:hypothetical protein